MIEEIFSSVYNTLSLRLFPVCPPDRLVYVLCVSHLLGSVEMSSLAPVSI